MRTKIYIIVVFLIVIGAILYGIYANQKSIENVYNNAINLIQNGSYDEALNEFEKANPNTIHKSDFLWDMSHNKLDGCYKNTLVLYTYSLAQIEYNKEDREMYDANKYLELIPEDYSGELAEEIKKFRHHFGIQYNEYLKEQERKAEEEAEKERERELKRLAEEEQRLKNSPPYVGMSESRINDTVLGRSSESFNNYEYRDGEKLVATVYRFKNSKGIIFVARCINGYVDSISDHRDSPYGKIKASDIPSEDYDVSDYYDAEDFYEDYYDDFYDYEDAEDYFDENRDW